MKTSRTNNFKSTKIKSLFLVSSFVSAMILSSCGAHRGGNCPAYGSKDTKKTQHWAFGQKNQAAGVNI